MGLPCSDREYQVHLDRKLQRTCPTCGVSFRASRLQQKHCSNACTVRFRRRAEDNQPSGDSDYAEYRELQCRADGLKVCTKCRQELPDSEEHFYQRRGRPHSWCRSCVNRITADRKRQKRVKVLSHYGGSPPKCACCGEGHQEFLCIDHTHGRGNEHRRSIGRNSGAAFYDWLVKEGYPEGFRVLCHNCNSATGFYGYCPHTRMR